MKKRIIKSAVSFVLVLAMVMSLCVSAFAAEFTLTWPTGSWPEGTPPQWALDATAEEQQATLQAIQSEYDNQRAMGFDMGEFANFGAWGDMVIAQFNGGDNTGNPWGFADVKKGAIIAPYAGMAFSVKAKFAEKLGSSTVPLSNQITWTNPLNNQTHTYQVYMNSETIVDGSGKFIGWGYCPGSNTTSTIAEVFKYTYAQSAWYNEALGKPVNLGCIHSNAAVTDDGIAYQEFFGNDSTGTDPAHSWNPAFGISYIVMPDQYGEEAYIITGDMMTAWATTWTQNGNEYDRFAKSGAPVGNQYVDNSGVVCQDFENCTIRLTDAEDPRNPEISSAGCEITDFAVGDNFVYQYDDVIEVYLTDAGADIKALAPTFTLSEGAAVDKASGTVQDFTEAVEYTVTAENGDSVVYTVYVEIASEPTDEDQAVCDTFTAMYGMIGDPVSYYDSGIVMGLTVAYDMLSIKQKYMLRDEIPVIEKYIAGVEAVYNDPIKIAFVGDSITDPGVNASNYAIQVGEDLAKAGLPFEVKNFGASGHCLSPNSDWPYTGTDKYRNSLSFNPDYVFIMLGTNDSKPRNWNDRNVKNTFKQDLINMVNTYRNLDSHPTVVIATVPTVREDYGLIDTISETNALEISAIQREVAEEMGCPLLDIHTYTAGHDDWFNKNDGVHPNVTGHTNIKVPYLEYLEGLMDANLSEITIDGEVVADFDPLVPIVGLVSDEEIDINDVEIGYTVSNPDATVEKKIDSEKNICYITVKSPLKHFSRTYMIAQISDFIMGDVDGNGVVNVSDMMTLKNLIMSGEWTAEQLARGDIDGNGTLNVSDMMAIKNIIMQG